MVIILVAAIFVAVLKFPQLGFGGRGGLSGFVDPGWDCVVIPQSQPVCIKRIPANSPNKATPSN